MNQDQLLEQAQRIVQMADTNEQIEVCCSSSTSTKIKVHGGQVESMTDAHNDAMGIRILNEGREGFASVGSFAKDAIEKAFNDARDNSQFAEKDEFIGIAEPDDTKAVEIDTWRESVFSKPVKEKVSIATELERRALEADKRISGVRVSSYTDGSSQVALASSNGIGVTNRSTFSVASIQVMSADGKDNRSGFGYDGGLESSEIDSEIILDRAVNRALNMLGSVKPESQTVDLVLEPDNAATFFGLIASMLNGQSVVKGRSPFSDRVSESIASELVTMFDDATDSESKSASAYDGEGLASRKVNLIESGKLQGFLHDSYTGRRYGTGSTASASRGVRSLPRPGSQALHVTPGEGGSEEDLISSVMNGLYVYDFAGLHSGVNPVSGDLSLGVEGVMIRDGKLCESVNECTINSTLQKMLLGVTSVGSQVEHLYSGVSTPAVVIEDVSLSGAGA